MYLNSSLVTFHAFSLSLVMMMICSGECLTNEKCWGSFPVGILVRFSPLQISTTSLSGFEREQNPSSGFMKRSCSVVINTTLRYHIPLGTLRRCYFVDSFYLYQILHWWMFCFSWLYKSLIAKTFDRNTLKTKASTSI